MQNEPNFKNAQMNTTDEITRSYENISAWTLGKNEPKTNPIYALGNKLNFKRNLAIMSHQEPPTSFTTLQIFRMMSHKL